MSEAPKIRDVVLICLACHNWQVDVRPGAVSDLGGNQAALMAAAQVNAEHIADCPGAGGRIKVHGKWVERPEMASGGQAEGVLGAVPFPAWWVAR